jgi:glucosamine-6-phosphate deaminase
VSEALRVHLADTPSPSICLPTGSTPAPVYAAFADRGGDLSSTTVILLDEFGLPPGSPARCDAMIERDLFSRLANRPRRLETWDTECDDLTAECRRMDTEAADGLDLAVLGLGANGHIGLNEPGSPSDSRSRVVTLDPATAAGAEGYGAEKQPQWGLTLGIGTLLGARSLWLLVTGDHKAGILREVVHGAVSDMVPATHLRTHPDVTVFADERAASRL